MRRSPKAGWARQSGTCSPCIYDASRQRGLEAVKRLSWPHFRKVVELFKGWEVRIEPHPRLLTTGEDLHAWRTLIRIVQSSNTDIPQLTLSNHVTTEDGDPADPATRYYLTLSARRRQFVLGYRTFYFDPVRLNDRVQYVCAASLFLTVTAMTALHENRCCLHLIRDCAAATSSFQHLLILSRSRDIIPAVLFAPRFALTNDAPEFRSYHNSPRWPDWGSERSLAQ